VRDLALRGLRFAGGTAGEAALVKRARVPGTFRTPRDLPRAYAAGYELVLAHVSEDERDLAWGSMLYTCTDEPTPARSIPPGWDRIVANAPPGYWDERGGVPETIVIDGVECFPAKPGGCGHEERYYLCVGVEGPADLRERSVFIPCPFQAGGCPECGLPMKHDRWNEDETFDELRPVPEGARYFRVPDEKTAREFADENYGGAELVDPHPATRRVA
jgi:hypothetical protein